jgi:hypothetical protein
MRGAEGILVPVHGDLRERFMHMLAVQEGQFPGTRDLRARESTEANSGIRERAHPVTALQLNSTIHRSH